MKKSIRNYLLVILALAVGLVICGCREKDADVSIDKQETKVDETQIVELIDSAEYKFERIDESIQEESGNVAVAWYFDKLVIGNSTPAAAIINADMDEKSAEFFSDSKKEEITGYYNDHYNSEYGDQYLNTAEGAVAYNNAGVISVNYTYDWFMGGVHNINYDGFTYDLNTGEKLYLADLLDGSDAEILARIQNVYWEGVTEHYKPEELFEEAKETFEAKTLDDYKFFVGDGGEIYLIVDTYEFAPGSAGAYVFASGLFISNIK